MKRLSLIVLSLLAAILATSHRALAQCPDWHAGPIQNINGLNGWCDAVTTYDPDGAGPLGPQLVIGGFFYFAGDNSVNSIARWDGTSWQPFGAGAGGSSPEVGALAVYPPGTPFAGQLVAAGRFTSMDGVATSNIARWDGSAWHPIGTGTNDIVESLTFWDPDGSGPLAPQLIAGGIFTTAGGATVNGIARFDGTAWQPLGTGVADTSGTAQAPFFCGVYALTSWDPDGAGPQPPQLIAGGFFDTAGGTLVHNIARWNGSTWASLSTGVDGDPAGLNSDPGVVALTVWDPDGLGPAQGVLVAGGYFDTAGGTTVNGIARWNGTAWSGFSTGMNDEVESLTVFGGQLVAGGDFTTAGGAPIHGAAVWTGSAWQSLGQGFEGDVYSMVPFVPPGSGTTQLAAGGFFNNSGTTDMHHLGHWDGTTWLPFTIPLVDTYVYTMAQMGSDMVVGGFFDTTNGPIAGFYNLGRWTGIDLTPFGYPNREVRALKSFTTGLPANQQQNLVVGGDFTSIGDITANRVALFTQSPFLVQGSWSTLGAGFTGLVLSIERYSNVIYAGGSFTASGVQPISHIAFWNGTAWQQVGAGLDGSVIAMKVYNGALYVGGSFTHAGSVATGGLARWDGANWTQVGGTFTGTVFSLEVYNNKLTIGGLFTVTGSPNLVQYDGTGNFFSILGSGGCNQVVRTICVGPDAALYIGGDFTSAGGVSCNRVAKWNGLAWSNTAGGADDGVFALCPYHNEVEAGGVFTNVRNSTIVTAGWARYSTDGKPFIVTQPLSAGSICSAQEASFRCSGSQGSLLTYQWRHNGVPITLGLAPSGTIFASDGPNLDIANAHGSDTGLYDCVISNNCGSVITISAPLHVNSADFNGDGNLGTDRDIEDFFACLSGSCCPTCGSADFNSDGDLGTDTDIEAFFRVLSGGRC